MKNIKRGPRPIPVEERFWAKVKKTDACWEWLASLRNNDGYGQISVNGRMHLAHRISWEIHFGPILENKGSNRICVLHKCDNRKCVRPDHLFVGSDADNVLDRESKGRGAFGIKQGKAKLTEKDVREIRDLYKTENVSQRKLANKYHVDHMVICRIVRGEIWKRVL